ncbi:DNA repair protein RecO [Candidatus Nomurabacteria bacterium RIFCSPLOWO2_01_FULL_41_21]|uniref:DNA repair protein RecO n=2 Tax=Candidatus Nomuraibacteriota TaxID=1752729 RepID=A0A1F6V165_9BACT|nr:MAG: DNA repair protein RecO [Candidatus Nomurabacteria bacterium RIFCSPHIGHO2_01_FULL_40_20]OGI88702.1 MAG: DNA repair protein RecO [Candidatus Nomurabacteria bacterium RIFCSPLOWO2_01_FULL_41_21]
MHHIYHTEGIILGSRNYGEAGKCFYIFTRELGLVYASAQGVRKLSSKLRYTLQDFSYINLDLVRGKDFWRVTTASKTGELEDILENKDALRIFANLAKLLRRLLAGEEKNEALFFDLIRGLRVLENAKGIEELRNGEVLLVLRVLYHLGYIGSKEHSQSVVTSPLEKDLVFEVSKNRAKILRQINQALRETHL